MLLSSRSSHAVHTGVLMAPAPEVQRASPFPRPSDKANGVANGAKSPFPRPSDKLNGNGSAFPQQPSLSPRPTSNGKPPLKPASSPFPRPSDK